MYMYICTHTYCYVLFYLVLFLPTWFVALDHGTWTDINECEQVPKPCAFQFTNTPGSFKCICPPGQHLLGDGKSCAGLERLLHSGAYYNIYNYAQFSPIRDNYQPQRSYRHSSNLYSSFSEYRNSRIPVSRTKRSIRETCPEGYEARNDRCVGKCQSCLCSCLALVLLLRLLFHIC